MTDVDERGYPRYPCPTSLDRCTWFLGPGEMALDRICNISFNEADARGFSEKGLSAMLRGFAGKPLITAFISHNAEKIDIAPIANPVSSSSPSCIVTFFDHNALVMLVGLKKEDNEHNWIKILSRESSHQGILGEGRFKTA